jgi:hypothetical protein
MPTYANTQVPPPKSWDEFEALVCSAAKCRWKNPDFTQHGRKGQSQQGIDVYGKDGSGRWVGLQCKNTVGGVSLKTIKNEVLEAESFTPPISHLYIATTAPTDAAVQALVRDLSDGRTAEGKFEVTVLFWGDIWNDLTLDEARLFQHYPQLKPAEQSTGPGPDRLLFESLIATLPFEPTVRLLRDHDFGAPFLIDEIRPLYSFYETWDQPEKEFIDKELRADLAILYRSAATLSNHITEKTVPIGAGRFASVYSDSLRADGPRPDWVLEEAKVLNEQASLFVPIYVEFVRKCRERLFR